MRTSLGRICVGLSTLLLAACGASVEDLASDGEALTARSLEWSALPSRADAHPLDGATLGGVSYIFLQTSRHPLRVSFYLDDPEAAASPVRTENASPFDFGGTAADGSARPFDARTLSAGIHALTAQGLSASGRTFSVTVRFSVAGETPARDGGAEPPADVTPPTAPAQLTASASSSSSIHLTWLAATDEVGVTQYELLREGAGIAILGPSSRSFDDTGLASSTAHTYAVRARDAAGNVGPASASATATTPSGGGSGGGSLTGCASVPSRCGYPDGTNTGPAAGKVLRKVPGEVTSGPGWAWESNFGRLRVTGAGAVLDGLDVAGPVVIDARGVTLENSVVTSCDSEGDVVAIRAGNPGNGYDGDEASILHNRLQCKTARERARSGIRDVYGAAHGLVARFNEITGTGNGITLESNGEATDNWIHDLGHLAGDHHSGLSNHGGASRVIYRHNTALLANTSTEGGGGLSGAITVYGDFARAQNVSVTDNLISGGAYTLYGGINNEDTYGQPTEIHLDGNRFVCNAWVYGPVFRRSGATNTFTGNYCDQDLAPVKE